MTILSRQTILALCKGSRPLVSPFEERQVRTASYDLRMGTEYSLGEKWSPIVRQLNSQHRVLEIQPDQVALVRTYENVRLPNNMVGHLSLKLDILLQGLVISSQSQIDAGYSGPIFALLYNLRNQPITLRLMQPLLRLEFATLDNPTSKPYQGDYKPDFSLGDIVDQHIRSGLASMRQDVMKLGQTVLEERSRTRDELVLAGIGIVVAIFAAGVAFLVPFVQDAADAKSGVERDKTTIDSLSELISKQQQDIEELKQQIKGRTGTAPPSPRATP